MEENISIVGNISLARKIFLFCVDIYTLWRMSLHFGEYHYIVEKCTALQLLCARKQDSITKICSVE